MSRKRVCVVAHAEPFDGERVAEALNLAMLAGSFGQHTTLIFTGWGIFTLKKNQKPEIIAKKNLSKISQALDLYDVKNIIVSGESMKQYSLKVSELVLPVKIASNDTIAEIIRQSDLIFTT